MSAEIPPSPPRGGMGAKAAIVSGATMLSRVLGLVREQLFASLFGAGMFSDAYIAAFRIPNLLRDLFAEGALSAAFVPTFAQKLRTEGPQAAIRLANVVLGAVLVVVGGITIAAILGAPGIVELLVPKFHEIEGKFELTVELTRVMMPFLLLVSLAAVVMGQLNAQERYGVPALAAASFNVVAILAGIGLQLAHATPDAAVMGWAIATVAGGAMQIAIQVPSLWRTGFRFAPRVDFRDPGLRRIALLMGPATIGLAATQLNIFVNTSFASGVHGAVSWLSYAFRIMQLPIGVFGVAIATIAATRFAHVAAERDSRAMSDSAAMTATMGHGLRLVAFLTVPSTLGLVALGRPIVRLLYERGRFGPGDTEAVTICTLMYGIGLYCYAAVKVVAPAFYALDRSRVPLAASAAAVAANLALNIALFPTLGYPGLALGTSVAAIVNFGVLLGAFRRSTGPMGGRALTNHFARVFVAGALCATGAWGVATAMEGWLGTRSTAVQIVTVIASVTAGIALYALGCRMLGVRELGEITARLRRKRPA